MDSGVKRQRGKAAVDDAVRMQIESLRKLKIGNENRIAKWRPDLEDVQTRTEDYSDGRAAVVR